MNEQGELKKRLTESLKNLKISATLKPNGPDWHVISTPIIIEGAPEESIIKVLKEAKADMPKKADYTLEKSGLYHDYNYGVAWDNWALKWFGERKESV